MCVWMCTYIFFFRPFKTFILLYYITRPPTVEYVTRVQDVSHLYIIFLRFTHIRINELLYRVRMYTCCHTYKQGGYNFKLEI